MVISITCVSNKNVNGVTNMMRPERIITWICCSPRLYIELQLIVVLSVWLPALLFWFTLMVYFLAAVVSCFLFTTLHSHYLQKTALEDCRHSYLTEYSSGSDSPVWSDSDPRRSVYGTWKHCPPTDQPRGFTKYKQCGEFRRSLISFQTLKGNQGILDLIRWTQTKLQMRANVDV